jgi:hypothetical protein
VINPASFIFFKMNEAGFIQAEDLGDSSAALEKLKDRFGKHIASLDVVTIMRHYKDAFFPFYKELQQVARIPTLEPMHHKNNILEHKRFGNF